MFKLADGTHHIFPHPKITGPSPKEGILTRFLSRVLLSPSDGWFSEITQADR